MFTYLFGFDWGIWAKYGFHKGILFILIFFGRKIVYRNWLRLEFYIYCDY